MKEHLMILLSARNAWIQDISVHVYPTAETDWTPNRLKKTMQAVVYFEKAFEVVLKPDSHLFNADPGNSNFQQCCTSLQQCVDTNLDESAKTFCLVSSIKQICINQNSP